MNVLDYLFCGMAAVHDIKINTHGTLQIVFFNNFIEKSFFNCAQKDVYVQGNGGL